MKSFLFITIASLALLSCKKEESDPPLAAEPAVAATPPLLVGMNASNLVHVPLNKIVGDNIVWDSIGQYGTDTTSLMLGPSSNHEFIVTIRLCNQGVPDPNQNIPVGSKMHISSVDSGQMAIADYSFYCGLGQFCYDKFLKRYSAGDVLIDDETIEWKQVAYEEMWRLPSAVQDFGPGTSEWETSGNDTLYLGTLIDGKYGWVTVHCTNKEYMEFLEYCYFD